MRGRKLTRMTLAVLLALALVPLRRPAAAQAADGTCTTSGSQRICTFSYTGAAQTWTVPEGVTSVTFDVFGAQGGGSSGGKGGEATATLDVTPGATYQIMVGGNGDQHGGFNGGGAGGGCDYCSESGFNGGGASDVRSGAFALDDRIIVAGGGGGSSGGGGAAGGSGGGDVGSGGGGGGGSEGWAAAGGGGSQTAGGAGGYSVDQGGTLPSYERAASGDWGGGGGGHSGYDGFGGGGGGGSGYGPSGVVFHNGVREGDGLVMISYTLLYPWSGFFQPIDNLPTLNSVKAGSAIPVKFSLGGDQGLAIFEAGYPKAQQIPCDGSAPADAIEQIVTASSSTLQYDPTSGQYTYVWKTEKSWAGSCRQLIVRLSDGSDHLANFKFQ